MDRDPYDVLGVPRGASMGDVTVAYRRLVMQHHPDRGGDAATFIEVQQAYETIIDGRAPPVDVEAPPMRPRQACAACHGTGATAVHVGLHHVEFVCQVCSGTGRMRR